MAITGTATAMATTAMAMGIAGTAMEAATVVMGERESAIVEIDAEKNLFIVPPESESHNVALLEAHVF